MTTKTNTILDLDVELLGIDLGYGAVKISSLLNKTQTPSFVGVPMGARHSTIDGIKRSKAARLIEFDDFQFYTGKDAHSDGRPLENLDYDRLLGSPEIKAVLYAALSDHGLGEGETVKAAVGIPMELIKESVRNANLAAIREWICGPHAWIEDGDEKEVIIESALITTQAMGAVFDYSMDDNGKPSKFAGKVKGEVGVVSVGFNTVELMVLDDRKQVQRFTSSTTNGVRRLLRLADPNNNFTLGELDSKHRNGSLDIKESKPVWSREIHGDIESVWGTAWERFDAMIWVGGGSIIMNGSRGRYEENAYDPQDAVMSIADGLLKFLTAKESRKNG